MRTTHTRSLRLAVTSLVLSSAALLGGCSGEPSAGDLEKAVAANASQGAEQMERLSRGSSKSFMPQVHNVKKLSCRQDTGAAWLCDIELDMTSPQGVRGKVPTAMRFIKGSEGWTASR